MKDLNFRKLAKSSTVAKQTFSLSFARRKTIRAVDENRQKNFGTVTPAGLERYYLLLFIVVFHFISFSEKWATCIL